MIFFVEKQLRNFAKKFLTVLSFFAVSLRNRKFTACLFQAEARNMLYQHCKYSGEHKNICSRHNKQTTFSGTKVLAGLGLN